MQEFDDAIDVGKSDVVVSVASRSEIRAGSFLGLEVSLKVDGWTSVQVSDSTRS
jgi:hypothetical protein